MTYRCIVSFQDILDDRASSLVVDILLSGTRVEYFVEGEGVAVQFFAFIIRIGDIQGHRLAIWGEIRDIFTLVLALEAVLWSETSDNLDSVPRANISCG